MDMHDDDQPIGRILSRREMLALLGGGGAALVAGLAVPSALAQRLTPSPTPSATPLPTCVVRPELTEGPFFIDAQLERFDIRTHPQTEEMVEGTPLLLIYRVQDVTGGQCAPLKEAVVDVWHCDAAGIYPGVSGNRIDPRAQTWLRGYQVTDEEGMAEFLTILPGWYPGRAVHIHFKIRTAPAANQGYDFTSQLFFDPEELELAYASAPYAERGAPNTPNSRDGIFQGSDGLLTVALVPLTDEEKERLSVDAGYSATFTVGLDLQA